MQLLLKPFSFEFSSIIPLIPTYSVYSSPEPFAFVNLAIFPDEFSPTLLASSVEFSFIMGVTFGNYKLAPSMHLIFLEESSEFESLSIFINFSQSSYSISFILVPET